MLPARSLLEKVRRGEFVAGTLATFHLWTDLVEISIRAGLDYLIIDLEHGAFAPELVVATCAAGRHQGFPVLIRPLANDYFSIRQALDWGACGLLLASVESAEELDVVRDAACVPPRGRRRPGGEATRWVSGYSSAHWKDEHEDQLVILPQIETRTGVAQAAAIAGHPITTALAVGPYDLSAELGVCGEMQAPVLQETLQALRKIAHGAGKPMWMISSDIDYVRKEDWRFICIGEPMMLLESLFRDRARRLKSGDAPDGGPAANRQM